MRTIRGPGLFIARFIAPEPPFDGLDRLAGPDLPFESRRGWLASASEIGAGAGASVRLRPRLGAGSGS